MTHIKTVLVIKNATQSGHVAADPLSGLLSGKDIALTHCYVENSKLRGVPAASPCAIVLYFPVGDHAHLAATLSKKLRNYYDSPHIPIIAALETPLGSQQPHEINSTLLSPIFPAQLSNRITAMMRLGDIQAELEMRVQTLSKLSAAPITLGASLGAQTSSENEPLNVLFIGKAAPEFMSIMNAFEEQDVSIVAAFTPFTAFDFLHEKSFDAVVLNALEHPEPAATILSTMRKNAKLYHVPGLALVSDSNSYDFLADPHSGANDVINASAPSHEIRSRILELANYRRTHELLKNRFSNLGGSASTDPQTGLFNEAFFKAHMDTHLTKAKQVKTALSIALLNPAPAANDKNAAAIKTDPDAYNAAVAQIGAMIKSMIRLQDCAARISETEFAILFSGETEQSVNLVVKRISDIIDHTAFESKNGNFKMSIKSKVSELQHSSGDAAQMAESA